jgi:hypothetical protein
MALRLRRVLLPALLALVVVAQPAAARYQTGGFNLEDLTALAGTGPDPGTKDLQARLKWAVETGVPKEWRESVRVVWSVGNTGPGHLALSYLDGRTVISARLMARSSEEVIATVAHEMGHQIAFALVSPVIGWPPQGFIDLARGYSDIREGWADCVSRVWTGSTLYTLSEAGPCNTELAGFVAGLVADPATLGATVRIVPPPIAVAPPPPPAPVQVPVPVIAPPPLVPVIEVPELPRPKTDTAAMREPAPAGSSGLLLALSLIPLALVICGVGYWVVKRRSPALLAWATGTPRAKPGRPGS